MEPTPTIEGKASTSTGQVIANSLRTDIIRGKLRSSPQLKKDEIAAAFGVSKIPVREALFQLKAEGLVTFLPIAGRWFRCYRRWRSMKSIPCALRWKP